MGVQGAVGWSPPPQPPAPAWGGSGAVGWAHPATGFGHAGSFPAPARRSREPQPVPTGTRGAAGPTLSMGPLFPPPPEPGRPHAGKGKGSATSNGSHERWAGTGGSHEAP